MDNSFTEMTEATSPIDISEIRVLRRSEYNERIRSALHANDVKKSDPVQRPGVFVPSHMLFHGSSIDDAALTARRLGVSVRSEETAEVSSEPPMTGHEYDGIQEYDNPTPGWWYMIFNATIVFSLLYVVIYHSVVPTQHERHAAAENRALEVRFAELRKVPDGEEKLLAIMAEPTWLAQGASVYQSSCTLCHGQQGEGLVGPNLTDNVYKNATSLVGLYDVILHGAGNGAMPARGGAPLKNEEIALVAAYVATLRGQNLEGPRGPEGIEIPPFPAPAQFDPSAQLKPVSTVRVSHIGS